MDIALDRKGVLLDQLDASRDAAEQYRELIHHLAEVALLRDLYRQVGRAALL